MKVIIRLSKEPSLKSPVLVGGIADSGYVARLALEHLVKELKAEPFGDVYCYGFPPLVNVRSDGTADLAKGELYYWSPSYLPSPSLQGPDLIIFTSDIQPVEPVAAYELSLQVLELGRRLGVELVYTVGAHIMGGPVERPRLYGTSTDPSLLEDLRRKGFLVMNQGNVTWMNGLLFGLAGLKGMKGIFLSAETPGFGIDAKAAQAVLKGLLSLLGLKLELDLTGMEERARALDRLLGAERRGEEVGKERGAPYR